MGNIARRANGQWRARYRDPAGHEHAKHFRRKVDAQQWLDAATTAIGTGSWTDPAAARTTVAEWAPQWLETKVNLKATTRAAYEVLMNRHILPRWGETRLEAVTHAGVARWVAQLSGKGLSGSSVRQAHRVFSLMLDLAVRDGRINRNPAQGVPLPRRAEGRQVQLTHEQVRRLAEAAGEYRPVILFLAYTGLRFGELAALRVERLDLDRRRALISEAVAEVHGAAVFSTPKNHQTRSVPIPRFLVAELTELVAGKRPDEFVFTTPSGAMLRISNFRHNVFEPAVRAVGLPHITPHALRHTAASLAIASGANVKVVQTMLGHKSATMTLDLYGHLFPDQLDEVADAMERDRRATTRSVKRSIADHPTLPGLGI